MKLSQLVVTAVLVAAGIVVYDLVVRQASDPPLPEAVLPSGNVADDAPSIDVLPPIHLEGTGDDLKWEELERRLALLEQAVGSDARLSAILDAGAAEGDESMSRAPESGRAPKPTEGDEPAEGEPDAAAEDPNRDDRVSEAQAFLNPLPATVEELRDFRKRLEWVERQRRIEKEAKGISDWLTAQGVSLTPAQRLDVVRAALVYRERARRLPQAPPDDEAAQEAQRGLRMGLRDDFVNDLYVMVPAAEADLIVEGMQKAADAAEKARREREAQQGR